MWCVNEKLVFVVLESKFEWVEIEFVKIIGLVFLYLWVVFVSLFDQGWVCCLFGIGICVVYGLVDFGFVDVFVILFIENVKKVCDYFEGCVDFVLYMSDQLCLICEEVMVVLLLFNVYGMIICIFVGSLVIFCLKEVFGVIFEFEVFVKGGCSLVKKQMMV